MKKMSMLLKEALGTNQNLINRKGAYLQIYPSSFQLIARRQRSHKNFAQSLMHPKSFTSKYVAQGIKYEPLALQEYEKFMFNRKTPVTVLKSSLLFQNVSLFLVQHQMLK